MKIPKQYGRPQLPLHHHQNQDELGNFPFYKTKLVLMSAGRAPNLFYYITKHPHFYTTYAL